jgi:hypothetical protein
MRRSVAASADLAARVWMMDLRRKSFAEMGGTSRPRDIWQCVRSLIETDDITDRCVPLALSPDQAKEVKRKAIDLVADCVASDSHAII